MENCGEGVKIGASDVSSPTCADGIALLAENQADAQIVTNTVHTASCKDRFIINPSKNETVKFKTAKKEKTSKGGTSPARGGGAEYISGKPSNTPRSGKE